MIVDKHSKEYEMNPLYPNSDWYGDIDSDGHHTTRDNIYVVDETTERGSILKDVIITHHPYISFVEDEGELVHVVVEETLVSYKTTKIQMIKKTCNNEILSGFESSAKGYLEFYGLDYEDQINMEALKNNVVLGLIPEGSLTYYAKGKPCEVWTNSDFIKLYTDAMAFKSARITKAKHLIEQVQNASTKAEIEAIVW